MLGSQPYISVSESTPLAETGPQRQLTSEIITEKSKMIIWVILIPVTCIAEVMGQWF